MRVIMRTSPRPNGLELQYSEQTIKSLRKAGFDGEVLIIAEPESKVYRDSNCQVIYSQQKLGSSYSMAESIKRFLSDEKDDFALLIEDDVVFSKDFLKHLPENKDILYSLYTPNDRGERYENFEGWVRFEEFDMHGSLAIYAHRNVFENIVGSYFYIEFLANNVRFADHLIYQSAHRIEQSIYIHIPSLVEHIGTFSSIQGTNGNENKGYKFASHD
jgi:GR25 family glycosyltransferase involved in LPS biosynthesis